MACILTAYFTEKGTQLPDVCSVVWIVAGILGVARRLTTVRIIVLALLCVGKNDINFGQYPFQKRTSCAGQDRKRTLPRGFGIPQISSGILLEFEAPRPVSCFPRFQCLRKSHATPKWYTMSTELESSQ